MDNKGDNTKSSEDLVVELDGKLRSGRLGLQCEALVGLPAIFDSHPFPTLVNAAFLKMAEVFRNGSNFLRLCIVKVTQQCSEHLRKVQSANEVVRRFSATLHSNDPIARALALRVLGALAILTAEKVSVQQSVREALVAHHKVEVDAAVYAARCFSAYNAQFAGSLVDKLSASVNGVSISPDMQLDLLPILQYVRKQADAEEARTLCVQLLSSQASKAQAVAAVHALSQLACTYIVHMSEHVSILLDVLERDARQHVCLAVLAALDGMACKAAHLWQDSHFRVLWDFLGRSQSTCLSCAALVVLNSLASSIVGDRIMTRQSYAVCQALCCNIDFTVASLACGVATWSGLATMQLPGTKSSEHLFDAVTYVQSLLTVVCTLSEKDMEQHRRGVQLTLSCAVKLSKACPSYSGDILRIMVEGIALLQPSQVLLLCRGVQRVVAVCSDGTVDRELRPVIKPLVQFAVENIGIGDGESVALAVAELLLCCNPLDVASMECILSALQRGRQWPLYCVARSAAERGVFQLAGRLFSQLASLALNEQYVRWLAGLADLCTAESSLEPAAQGTGDICQILSESNAFLFKAVAHFGMAQTGEGAVDNERVLFVKQYCYLRSEMLSCVRQLLTTATAMKAASVHSSGIRGEMIKSLSNVQVVSRGFSNLYQSAFNADLKSLLCLRRLSLSCDFIVDSCNSLYMGTDLRPVHANSSEARVAVLRDALSRKLSHVGDQLTEDDRFVCLSDVIVKLVSSAVNLPPFVFNNHQGTRVQIALWPTPILGKDHVALDARTHLVMRVEGAVQQEGSVTYRKVEMVHIRVTSIHEPGPDASRTAGSEAQGLALVKSLNLEGDSFAAEFVLNLVPDVNAVHRVTLDVSVSDTDGVVWTTGPRRSVKVIVDQLSPTAKAREALHAGDK